MLSLILPTYNESQNLPDIVAEISRALAGIPHEIIVVDDDSPDGTWRVAESLKTRHPQLTVLRRIGRRGLSSAVVEGFRLGTGTVLAVMDADGQHDGHLLVGLYRAVQERGAGIAIGSRYVEGGGIGEWDGGRHKLSKIATKLAMVALRRSDVGAVRDPMSGFFAIRKDLFDDAYGRLRPKGFKILLDVLLHVKPGTPIIELPLKFGVRRAGVSKLDWKVQVQYLEYLYDVTLGTVVPLRTLAFGLVLLAIAASCAIAFWPLLPLYASAAVRGNVQAALTRVAEERGWLISDLAVESIDDDAIHVVHRQHPPRAAAQTCDVPFPSSFPIACAEF